MAFAASLSLQESVPEKCPHIQSPLGEQAFYPVYDAKGKLISTVAININTARTGALQNATKESSNPNATARLEMDSENVEEANMRLPMPLSSRELEVLSILAEGASNNEISRMLNISPHTVKSHVIHIFNKLGVNDRTQAAVWAARHQLI
ncbi:MAG: response regulator transcription factor [Deltaproteobacteria bacterium]|nr:response regulator transcription factor [Deltaproteobacteria bacterium]